LLLGLCCHENIVGEYADMSEGKFMLQSSFNWLKELAAIKWRLIPSCRKNVEFEILPFKGKSEELRKILS